MGSIDASSDCIAEGAVGAIGTAAIIGVTVTAGGAFGIGAGVGAGTDLGAAGIPVGAVGKIVLGIALGTNGTVLVGEIGEGVFTGCNTDGLFGRLLPVSRGLISGGVLGTVAEVVAAIVVGAGIGLAAAEGIGL
ncbi:MAG: hypothetical protein WCV82_01815 [Candidatus Paceibacterota bacterium]